MYAEAPWTEDLPEAHDCLAEYQDKISDKKATDTLLYAVSHEWMKALSWLCPAENKVEEEFTHRFIEELARKFYEKEALEQNLLTVPQPDLLLVPLLPIKYNNLKSMNFLFHLSKHDEKLCDALRLAVNGAAMEYTPAIILMVLKEDYSHQYRGITESEAGKIASHYVGGKKLIADQCSLINQPPRSGLSQVELTAERSLTNFAKITTVLLLISLSDIETANASTRLD
ncbi:hypothetical protein TWF730_002073 [Orbilia blumenaviensis]|uniref:Uncharacterized protein n=1 Tax=Orbilia blumenaviensis TaxID=1796055 RepID=A0AAV9UCW1_9PEZI